MRFPFLQFTAKTLNRQAKKAQKDENTEKNKLKKACPYYPIYDPALTSSVTSLGAPPRQQ
jgi:hypothetical protein